MKAYSYNKITKEYICDVDCQLDPLETKKTKKKKYLLPFGATFIKPPFCADKEKQIFSNNEWVVVPDHRGSIYYNIDTKEQLIIKSLNEAPDIKKYTEKEPIDKNDYCVWSGQDWVIDQIKKNDYDNLVIKENLIAEEIKKLAIDNLKVKGFLDENENIVEDKENGK